MMRVNRVHVAVAGLFTAMVIMSSCAQAPVRKKMPGYLNAEEFESSYPFKTKVNRMEEFSLTTGDENLLFEGSVQKFITVPLPDPTHDLLVADLIEQYKPFASMAIATMAKQGSAGVIIDFRNGTQQGSSATYRVEKNGEFSIPVIFRWDNQSASRADVFMALLQSTPGFNSIRVTQ